MGGGDERRAVFGEAVNAGAVFFFWRRLTRSGDIPCAGVNLG